MIEGFLLVSSYAGEDGGGDVNNSVGDVIPSAEHANGAAVLAVELKDALSRSLMESPNSLAGTPEMEGENMNTRCANGELVSILVSAGCHGGEAIVETHSANSDDLSVATKAPGGVLSANDVASLQDMEIETLTEVIPLRLGGLDATTFTKADAFEEQCIKVDYPSMSSNLAIMEENEWLLEGTANGAFPNKQCTFESKERRTRQDIIAKVESWNSCKQHTQLKTLLVEANDSMKNIPMHQAPTRITRNHVPEKDGPIKGFPAASISEHFVDACAKDEAQKEWNSPARLPSSRNDKRKIKSKPHWVPFLCCPSLH